MNDRNSGFVTVGRLVFVLILFGGYTLYEFLPLTTSSKKVRHAIESVLEESTHETTDSAIRATIVRRANVFALPLEAEAIEIEREIRPGERVVHVAIDYPVTVSYLGSDRIFERAVHVTKVFPVNEAMEARREEARERQREAEREWEERARRRADNFQEAWDECEGKHGKGNCVLTTIPGESDSDEIVKMY